MIRLSSFWHPRSDRNRRQQGHHNNKYKNQTIKKMSEIDTQSTATATASDAACKTGRLFAKRRCYTWQLWAAILILTPIAMNSIGWVGYLFGWIVGASMSPIATVSLPLVFTLLGAAGITAGIRSPRLRISRIVPLIGICLGVLAFCYSCDRGIRAGGETRYSHYRSIEQLLGKEWSKINADAKTELFKFRWRADDYELSFDEYESFMTNVIKPLLSSCDPGASTKIIQELKRAEAALLDVSPKPANADNAKDSESKSPNKKGE